MANPYETPLKKKQLGPEDPAQFDSGDSDSELPSDPTSDKLVEGGKAAELIQKAPAEAIDPNSVQGLLQKYRETLDDPKFKTDVPQGTREDLAAKLKAAESEYQEKQTTNDWGQVAQAFTNAFTNYHLAKQGLQNYAGPGLQFDFEKRAQRLLDEHKQKKQDIGADYEAGQKQYEMDRQAREAAQKGQLGYLGKAIEVTGDEAKQKQSAAQHEAELARRISEFGTEQENKKTEADTHRQFEKEKQSSEQGWKSSENSLDRQNRMALEKLKLDEDKKKEGKNKNLSGVLSSIDKQNQVLQNQLKNTMGKEPAVDQLFEEVVNYDSLPKKEKSKADARINKLAAQAGVDSASVRKSAEEVPAEGGFLGFGQHRDKQKQMELLSNKYKKTLQDQIGDLRNQIDTNNKRRENIAVTGEVAPTEQAQQQAPAPQQAAGKGAVSAQQLSDYAKQHFSGNAEAARKFLSSQGYQVE